MMKIRSQCEGCNKMKWFARKRVYNHIYLGRMTSQGKLCRSCYLKIRNAVAHELKN